jgi:hypothetical protein
LYADFHYSVLGEYAELSELALSEMGAQLREKLFDGLEERLTTAAERLDGDFTRAFGDELGRRVDAERPEGAPEISLGPLTDAAVRDTIGRVAVTVPLASVAATAAGSGALKVATVAMAKKLSVKIAGKAAAKGVGKGAAAIGGAGTGAALCAPTGPVAVLCGAVGGVVAWFATDALVVNIDEYFNRDEFEQELRALIDADKADKKRQLEAALEQKARKVEDFTLSRLGTPISD